ncbi:MAG: hypothetical protein CMJ94_15785 [Planctomycetes bacterium]|nr:hypothetical protein [Planctomycetota bacterium]
MLRFFAPVLVFGLTLACMKAPDPDVGLRQASQESSAAETEPEQVEPPVINMAGLEGWQEKATTMSFQLAAWDLPGGGVATISWLGPSKETIAMNLDRWLGQWQTEGGSPAQDGEIKPHTDGKHPFTFVRVRGILTDVRQVGGGEPRQDWTLLGAIVDSPKGPLYVKAVGPHAELGEQAEAFLAAVRELEVK